MKEQKRKTLGKKLLVALLSVMMTVTFIPTSLFAFAAEPDVTSAEVQDEVVQDDVQNEDVQDEVQTEEEVQAEPTEATEATQATEAVKEEPAKETEAAQPKDAEQKEEVKEDEPKLMPAKLFTEKLEGVTVEVDTPEGTFDQKVKLVVEPFDKGTLEYMASKFVLKKNGQEFDGMLAYDIHFENSKGKEVEPNKKVTVDLTVEKEAIKDLVPEAIDADSVQVAHIGGQSVDVVADVADETDGTVEVAVDEETVKSIKASFKIGSFSPFIVKWTADGVEQSATIHWGSYEGSTFNEFKDTTQVIDISGSSVDLAVNIDDYYYVGAEYKETEDADPTNLNTSVLKKENGVWTVQTKTESTDGNVTTNTVPLADGSHVYVNYASKESGSYTPPPAPSGSAEKIAPETKKKVTNNQDGTYTIQLDVVGHEDHSETKIGANVIVVMDITQSMTSGISGGTTRMAAAKDALDTLITTLNPGTGEGQNLINFAAVNFGNNRDYTLACDWTSSRSDMESYVSGLPNNPDDFGTCWQAGLRGGDTLALQAKSNADLSKNKTYVLFLTDGNPNCYADNPDGTGAWHGSTGPNFSLAAYNASLSNAVALAGDSNLYGVFVGDADGLDHLTDLITYAGGVDVINGNTASNMQTAFKNIAQTIVSDLGAGNVTVDDGIPSLSNISANVTAGEAGGFEYYITPADGSQTEWTEGATGADDKGAPGASYDESNGVTWDLGEAGTLKEGWTYTLKFTVWPSQEAYDTIADLNNGLITMTPQELEDAGIGQNDDGTYYLLTNTHLNTTFTDPNGTTYDVVEEDVVSEAMALPTETISVQKIWNNFIDQQNPPDKMKLILQKDGKDYLAGEKAIEVSENTGWKKDDIYISVGQIKTTGDGYEILETGHDYEIVEPDEEDLPEGSYRWELTSEVYHPMVIDGKDAMLIQNDNATGEDGTAYYTIGEHKYVKSKAETNKLQAWNDRRSWLQLEKKISEGANKAPKNALFEFTVTIDTGESGEDVWFSAWDPDKPVAENPVKDFTTNATPEEGDTGYFHAASGTAITMKVKAGWTIRFTNLPTGSTYEIEETSLPDGFAYDKNKTTGRTVIDTGADQDAPEDAVVNGTVVSGEINVPNCEFYVDYANKYAETGITVTKKWEPASVAPAVAASAFKNNIKLVVNGEESTDYNADDYLTITEKQANTYEIKYENLPAYIGGEEATYKVKETTVPEGYTVDPENGEAEDGGTITNTLPTGDLKITKAVEGIELSDLPKSLKFTVTGPNSYKNTIEYGDFEDGSYTIKDLALGEYTVTEDTDSAAVDGYTLEDTTYSPEGGKATVVEGDNPVEVTVTNTYSLDTGKLKIVKKVDGLDASKLPEGLKFTVTGPNDYSKEIAYTDFQDGEYTIEDELPVGEYTVAESDASVDGYTLDVTYSPEGGKVKVTKSETAAEVTVTNKYTEITPEIPYIDPPVKKIVKGDAPKDAETYTFMLECYATTNENGLKPMPEAANGQTSMTVNIKGNGEKEFGKIYYTEEGVYDYRISEVAGSNENCEYDTTVYLVRATVTKDPDTGDLTVKREYFKNSADNPVDVSIFEFTNTYTAEDEGTATGDNNNLMTPLILLIMSGLGIAAAIRFRRREDETL